MASGAHSSCDAHSERGSASPHLAEGHVPLDAHDDRALGNPSAPSQRISDPELGRARGTSFSGHPRTDAEGHRDPDTQRPLALGEPSTNGAGGGGDQTIELLGRPVHARPHPDDYRLLAEHLTADALVKEIEDVNASGLDHASRCGAMTVIAAAAIARARWLEERDR